MVITDPAPRMVNARANAEIFLRMCFIVYQVLYNIFKVRRPYEQSIAYLLPIVNSFHKYQPKRNISAQKNRYSAEYLSYDIFTARRQLSC